MSFKIITDSSANLTDELIEELDVEVASLSFYVNGEELKSYEKGVKTDLVKFYDMMRRKEVIKTSLVSPQQFKECFEKYLKNGEDILCVPLSSGISGTYQSAVIAMDDLKIKYPDRKIFVVDTLTCSLGQGILVYIATKMKREDKSIECVNDWLEENKLKICCWFTVSDLFFLSRGGRLPSSSAAFGTVLNIKPIMHLDNEGKIVPCIKLRGRKQSLDALVDKFKEYALDKENLFVGISHGDCEEDAQYIASRLRRDFNVKNIFINYLDPVLGAHGGPGTICFFFWTNER